MGGRLRARIVVTVTAGLAALGGVSCGGGSGKPGGARDGGNGGHGGQSAVSDDGAAVHDGGAGGYDGAVVVPDGGDSDAARCPVPGALTAEPAPRQVALDGGLPLDQLVYALAVARCDYLSRCFALSTYAANDCVDQLVGNRSFGYPPSGTTTTYPTPSAALLQAAAAGVVHYDPRQEAACIAALLAEGCAGYQLIEELPACAGVFTCAPAGDGGGAPADEGAEDGGSTCGELVSPYDQPVQTCSTDEDCAAVPAAYQGPDCVAGICAPSRCGIFPIAGGCSSFAAAGQPCGSNAFSALNAEVAADGVCAPGLDCQGATSHGGLGTCVVPVDVGAACSDDANCKPGLACACGTCQIPPASGPCVNGLCDVGLAYCDSARNTCRAVRSAGASCSDAFNSCAPGLFCDGTSCQPPP
jgi:hypothetical protein